MQKSLSIKFNQTAAANHGKWPLRIQFQRFGANFADRWPRWTGARLIEVHLHSKLFGGTLKWPLKGGSRLIQVTATAGLTVHFVTKKISPIRRFIYVLNSDGHCAISPHIKK